MDHKKKIELLYQTSWKLKNAVYFKTTFSLTTEVQKDWIFFFFNTGSFKSLIYDLNQELCFLVFVLFAIVFKETESWG